MDIRLKQLSGIRQTISQGMLWTIEEHAVGMQTAGYWYETDEQVHRQAYHLASKVISPNIPAFGDLYIAIYNSILLDAHRGWYNEPYFVDEIYAAALQREEEFLAQFEDYHQGQEEAAASGL